LVGRAVVSVPYLGIANLLLGRDAWPEFIQGDAKPVALARRLMECEARAAHQEAAADAAKLRALLGEPAAAPDAAAHWLEKNLFDHR
ncbi:MAG TPA: lipid-A-disaccharide synthase, partial [Opitutales bacterium]|nr:lipid-A-disaccharide synthase [Opitutales bacterium]